MGGKPNQSKRNVSRRQTRARLPEGILTFLLTDVEGSTPWWERHQAVMGTALARHEALIRETVASHGGQLINAAAARLPPWPPRLARRQLRSRNSCRS
jgi:class 3 adenylate cyclase